MSTDFMRADSHIHLFERGFVGPEGKSPAGGSETVEYERYREHFDIESALVVGYEGDETYRGNSSYLANLARQLPWVKPIAYLDRPTPYQEVTSILDDGFYGLSVYATDPGDGERLAETIRQASPVLAERSAVVSLNVAPAVYGELRRALDAAPAFNALISHFGLPAKGAEDARAAGLALQELHSFRDMPGVAVKASGFYAFTSLLDPSEVLEGVVEAFGTERVLWGSDYPVVLSSESFEQASAHTSGLLPEARGAVMGDNLRRILAQVERT